MADSTADVSIVVVAWNVAPFIEQAVKSCLGQTLAGVETIIVENASTDGTRPLIENLVAGHGNARIIANNRNAGLGAARNQGMAAARGRYVAFLDGDDWLEPNAMEAAYGAARKHDADVVVFDHSRHHQSGKVQRAHNARYLRDGLCRTLAERFGAIRSFSAAWNKLYRLDFLKAEGFKFANTYYEDVDWSFPILMVAPRLATLPMALVNYRLRRGSILRAPSPRHTEVYERWRATLDFMKANAQRIDPSWRMVVAGQMARQQEAMLRSPLRGSLRQRVNFAQLARPLYREIDPGCELRLGLLQGLRYRLAWHGWSRLALALTLATTWPKR